MFGKDSFNFGLLGMIFHERYSKEFGNYSKSLGLAIRRLSFHINNSQQQNV